MTKQLQVSVGQNKNDYLQYAAASADGGIIAVGHTEGDSYSGDDILITKIGTDGHVVFEKIIGTYSNDRCSAFDEDMFGFLYIVGTSEFKDKNKAITRFWLKKMNDKGEVVFDKIFLEDTTATNQLNQVSYVKYDGASLNILGIEHDSLKSWRINTEGGILADYAFKNVKCLSKLDVKKCTVLPTVGYTYIYGLGKVYTSEKQGQAFVLKIDENGKVVGDHSYPDINAKDIGNIILTEQGELVLTGTTNKVGMIEENVFALKIDTPNLSTDKKFEKTYGELKNFDEGDYIYQSSPNTLTIFGSSKSHKPVSRTTNFMMFNISAKDGQMLDKKPVFWGDEQDDQIQTIVKTNDGSLWICGSEDEGGKLGKNMNFYFARIYTPTTPIIIKPIIEKKEEEPTFASIVSAKTDTLLAGSKMVIDFKVKVKVEDKNFKGYKIKTSSTKVNNKVQLPEAIDLSNKRWQDLDLALPISVDADLEKEEDMPITLCLYNPQGRCLDTIAKNIHVKPTPKPRYEVVNTIFKGIGSDTIFKSEKATFSITLKNVGNAKGKNFLLNMTNVNNVIFIDKKEYQESEWLVGQSRTFTYQFVPQVLIAEPFLELKFSYRDATTPSVFVTRQTPLREKKVVVVPVLVAANPQKPKDEIAVKPNQSVQTNKVGAPKTSPTTTENAIILSVSWRNDIENEKNTIFTEDYKIQVNATGSHKLAYKNFTIIHNGVEKSAEGGKMDEVSLDSKPNDDGSYAMYFDFPIKLSVGENTIIVKAKDGTVEKKTRPFKLKYQPADKGTLYVLSIGVPDASGRLHYTQKDALDFAKIFKGKADKREVQVVTLTTPDSTTAKSILSQITELSRQATNPNDAFVLYMSTHGLLLENKLRLLASDYSVDSREVTSIDFRDVIVKKLQKLPCSKYLFLDACKSGSAKDQKEMTDSLNNIFQNSSFFALTSCSGSESSYEDERWQNGAFTKVLKEIVTNPSRCKSLDGKNGTKPDGVLSMEELYLGLSKDVQNLVKTTRNENQTPQFIKPQNEEKRPIFDF